MAKKLQGCRKKQVRIALIGVGVAAVIAVTAVVTIRLAGVGGPAGIVPEAGGRGTVVMPENVDEIRDRLESPVQDGAYRTRMNVDWVFPSPGGPSTNAYVENAANNTRTVYFDLILADTGELIYSSPFIPVGAKLENFSLDAQIPAGKHSAVVIYHLVDEYHHELTTVSVNVTLHIAEQRGAWPATG